MLTLTPACPPAVTSCSAGSSRIASADGSPEAALVGRLRSGDGEAYEILLRDYGPRMLSTARRIVGCDHDARDALQEAVLAVHRSIERYVSDGRFAAWLHRIIVNASLMQLRARRRSCIDFDTDAVHESHLPHAEAIDVSAESCAAETNLERRECRDAVRRCIAMLPKRYRRVLIKRDIEGLDTETTAAELGITPGNVKIRLHRARRALRLLVEEAGLDRFAVGDERPGIGADPKSSWRAAA